MARAFTLAELLAVVCIGACGAAVAPRALGPESRVSARDLRCAANMRQLGIGAMSYAADFQDRVAGFTWRAGLTERDRQYAPPVREGGIVPADDLEAQRLQALDILERRGGIPPGAIKAPPGWAPQIEHSHLVVADYLGGRLGAEMAACPADLPRLEGIEAIKSRRAPADVWSLASSYHATAGTFVPNRFIRGGSFRQGEHQRAFRFEQGQVDERGGFRLGGRKLADVAMPANKVNLHEGVARHQPPAPVYFTHPDAKVRALMFDGSVQLVATGRANPGGYVLESGEMERPATVEFVAAEAEREIAWPGDSPRLQPARFRFTLRGLGGIDVGGQER
jgi:hypothetical protein